MMHGQNNTTWFEQLPKVELHLHLEGAIPLPALWDLICKYGGDSSVPTQEALKERFEFQDFPHFIDTWVWKNGFLREYEDFTFIAEAVAWDLARQNIRYAEIFYSPPDFSRHGLTTQLLTEAIRKGLSRVPGVEISLVADLVRDFGPDKAARTLCEVSEVKALGVVGIGIGGSEHSFPPEPFESVFETARCFGFRTSAHAGEASGPQSVWGALRALRVDRIGHGTRAAEDAALLDYLAENRIPLEMCPVSNVRTGIVRSMADHPVRRFFEQGVFVTVNTDDPKMFGNTLCGEYEMLVDVHGFTKEEILSLILDTIRASWLPEDRKQRMVENFQCDPSWQSSLR